MKQLLVWPVLYSFHSSQERAATCFPPNRPNCSDAARNDFQEALGKKLGKHHAVWPTEIDICISRSSFLLAQPTRLAMVMRQRPNSSAAFVRLLSAVTGPVLSLSQGSVAPGLVAHALACCTPDSLEFAGCLHPPPFLVCCLVLFFCLLIPLKSLCDQEQFLYGVLLYKCITGGTKEATTATLLWMMSYLPGGHHLIIQADSYLGAFDAATSLDAQGYRFTLSCRKDCPSQLFGHFLHTCNTLPNTCTTLYCHSSTTQHTMAAIKF
jgi:hypothetical protein